MVKWLGHRTHDLRSRVRLPVTWFPIVVWWCSLSAIHCILHFTFSTVANRHSFNEMHKIQHNSETSSRISLFRCSRTGNSLISLVSWTAPPCWRTAAAFSSNECGTPPPPDRSSMAAGRFRDARTLQTSHYHNHNHNEVFIKRPLQY